jgi:DNA repair exonuclease
VSKRIVVASDIQFPFEDRRLVRSFIRFVGEYQPDELVQIGDLMDFPQPSRWSKDTAEEFKGSVFADAEYAVQRFWVPIREVYDGPIKVMYGNHDERPRVYLAKYAPALAESRAFDLDVLLKFDDYGVELLPDFYDFTPGWTMTHGHKGGIRMSQEAGKTALNAAIRFNRSVIMGHTHRLAVVSRTVGYDGVGNTLTGFEVGHMLNQHLVGYLKGATPNWQQGFGVVRVDGHHVSLQPVNVDNGKFVVDGQTFKLA